MEIEIPEKLIEWIKLRAKKMGINEKEFILDILTETYEKEKEMKALLIENFKEKRVESLIRRLEIYYQDYGGAFLIGSHVPSHVKKYLLRDIEEAKNLIEPVRGDQDLEKMIKEDEEAYQSFESLKEALGRWRKVFPSIIPPL